MWFDSVRLRTLGSPPPMRGKALDKPFSKLRCRITPAYAGKSSAMSRIRSLYWDHPRLCGEKSTTDKLPRHCRGSPPPMRGKVWTRFELGKMAGITPPMRGKGLRVCKSYSPRRITPAYAGKRALGFEYVEKKQDHPRLCGEKFIHSIR